MTAQDRERRPPSGGRPRVRGREESTEFYLPPGGWADLPANRAAGCLIDVGSGTRIIYGHIVDSADDNSGRGARTSDLPGRAFPDGTRKLCVLQAMIIAHTLDGCFAVAVPGQRRGCGCRLHTVVEFLATRGISCSRVDGD